MLSDRCPVCLSVCDVGVLRPNGWTDQDETWQGGRPGHIVLDEETQLPSSKGSQFPNFRPISVAAKRLHAGADPENGGGGDEGLGAVPPAGSSGRAPGGVSGVKAPPPKARHFWII